jgi:antimicrobial peptide system SdpA family protein
MTPISLGKVHSHFVRRWQLLLCSAIVLQLVYDLHSEMPRNAATLPLESRFGSSRLVPEGWAFFTRNPQLPQTFIFSLGQGGQLSRRIYSGALRTGFPSASRQTEAILVELALVTDGTSSADWTECASLDPGCLALAQPRRVADSLRHPRLCGSIAVVERAPVPWAWSRSDQVMPSRLLELEVSCAEIAPG